MRHVENSIIYIKLLWYYLAYLYLHIPLSLVPVLNIAIIYKINKSSDQSLGSEVDRKKMQKQRSIAEMLITVSICFIVTTLAVWL